MKFIVIGIAAVALILIGYDLYVTKKSGKTIGQQTSSLETNNDSIEKPIQGAVKDIKAEAFDRFILTKNTTEDYLTNAIKEFGELSGNEAFNIYNFGIAQHGDWKVVKVDDSLSFFVYHNLVGWFSGYEENPDIPEISIGFAKNKTDSTEDYLFFLDPENQFGDTQIGAFRNGDSFSIYLPEAYDEFGNLTLTNELDVSLKEQVDFIAEKGFNIENVLSLNYSEYKIKMNE